MKRHLVTAIFLSVGLTVIPAPAQTPEPDAEDEVQLAEIVTHLEGPDRCISPVVIRKIDGEEAMVHPRRFEIEPGLHAMNGFAAIDTRACPVVRGAAATPVPDLEAEFEAGRTYYIGLDHRSQDQGEWRLVIWQVEEGGVPLELPPPPGEPVATPRSP